MATLQSHTLAPRRPRPRIGACFTCTELACLNCHPETHGPPKSRGSVSPSHEGHAGRKPGATTYARKGRVSLFIQHERGAQPATSLTLGFLPRPSPSPCGGGEFLTPTLPAPAPAPAPSPPLEGPGRCRSPRIRIWLQSRGKRRFRAYKQAPGFRTGPVGCRLSQRSTEGPNVENEVAGNIGQTLAPGRREQRHDDDDAHGRRAAAAADAAAAPAAAAATAAPRHAPWHGGY